MRWFRHVDGTLAGFLYFCRVKEGRAKKEIIFYLILHSYWRPRGVVYSAFINYDHIELSTGTVCTSMYIFFRRLNVSHPAKSLGVAITVRDFDSSACVLRTCQEL